MTRSVQTVTISEMLIVINKEVGRVIVKDGGKKILANPYKFICEGDEYVLYRNAEKIGMTEVLRTTDEDKACRIFIKELKAKRRILSR